MLNYNMEETSKRIRALRLRQGYTQEEAAERVGVERSYYSRMERGIKGCSVDVLARTAQVYGVSLDYLVLGPGWALQFQREGLREAQRLLEGILDGSIRVQEARNGPPGPWNPALG